MIHDLNFLHKDHRQELAILRYILTRCCRILEKRGKYILYEPLDWLQLKWIIDRANYLSGKRYALDFFPYSLLTWLEDSELVPDRFDTDWSCNYETDAYNFIKLDKNKNPIKTQGYLQEEDFLSGADVDILNNVIFRWKLYGKLLIMVDSFLYKLKNKIKITLKKIGVK